MTLDSFSIASLKPLVIGRGPVRLEALEVFAVNGITKMGMLLSRKDAYAAPYGQAPELRALPAGCAVHLVSDYMPQGSKDNFIREIIQLCQAQGYNSIFAGYGFLAEDPDLSAAVQAAGLFFIGPSPHVSRQAGAKDAAKLTAKKVGASVVPGENCLLGKAYILQCLYSDATHALETWQDVYTIDKWMALPEDIRAGFSTEKSSQKEENNNNIKNDQAMAGFDQLSSQIHQWLEQELAAGREHLTDQVILKAAVLTVQELWDAYPAYDLRIKAIHGGGGKGQRILRQSENTRNIQARTVILDAFAQVWSEVGVAGRGCNKNCVIELNIPLTRHWEIQLVGNGQWCLALGGRDCSVQRFEQKLVEFSLTEESLVDHPDGQSLVTLEAEAVAFAEEVKLDSVSTYEAIVSLVDRQHFFMEVNTRLQVEHRVTELLYALEFDCAEGVFQVQSLVHLMCLLALHGPLLPKPRRVCLAAESLEVRINSMNNALKPAVGSFIQAWSKPKVGEIRDDQGISKRNPDTGLPMAYFVSGAYDSNLALSLVYGKTRDETYAKMLDVLGGMRLFGRDIETNIPVLLGVIATLRQAGERAIATQWIIGYLNMAACVKEKLNQSWMLSLNPHRVIAWFFERNPALLSVKPGAMSTGHLQALDSICRELKIQGIIEQGLLQGPLPSIDADKLLDPPPSFDDCTIRAPSGGVYFAQPGPDAKKFVVTGMQVKKGDTLCIIEVMKMFNPILSPETIVIEEICVADGDTVKKGQALMRFKIA